MDELPQAHRWHHLPGVLYALAALFALAAGFALYTTATTIIAAEGQRQANLAEQEARLRAYPYYTYGGLSHLAAERARTPDLAELVVTHAIPQALTAEKEDAAASAASLQPSLARLALIAALAGLAFLATAALWVWHATRSLEGAGMKLKRSAPMAAATFFIPLLNLVLPAETMRELYNRSHGEPPENAHAVSDDVRAWFFTTITGLLIMAGVMWKIIHNLTQPVKIVTPYWMDLVILVLAGSLLIGSTVLFAWLASRITRAQREFLQTLDGPLDEHGDSVARTPSVSLISAPREAA